MQTRNITLTPTAAMAFADNYNNLVTAGNYAYISECLDSGAIEGILGHHLTRPYTTPYAICLAYGTAIIIKGEYGLIAMFKHGQRRKVSIVAEDAFWHGLPFKLDDDGLVRLLVKKGYIDKSRISTPNLEWNVPSTSTNWSS